MTARPSSVLSRRRAVASGAALFALGGCALGPAYRRPVLEIPAAYRATEASAAAAWPSETWWRGFRSAELDQLIDAARVHNFDIQAAIARVRQADAQARIAGSPLLPTVSASSDASWSRQALQSRGGGGNGRVVESRSYSLGPSISYEVDLWGKLRAGREAATATALASRFDQQVVALTVVASVASTWFQALALQDRLAVAARNIHDSEAILAAIRARQAAGTASDLDVAQQETLVAGLRAQVPALQSQLEQQLNALGILTGRPPSAVTVRPGTLATLALPPVAPGLPSALLARRPDVAEAEVQLRAANADIRAARANFFPQIQLSGALGWQNIALSTLFGPGSLFLNAAASATQSIFNNGLTSAQVEQARGRYDELLADYRKAVVQAFTDVENAVQAYKYASAQQALQQRAVDTAQRAANIARAQLLAGTVDLVTALQAQTALFSDLDGLAQVRLARFQALLSLYKALGGGWSVDDVTRPANPVVQGVL
ncbi:MAG TPA: efflux transporter outer membrane subunit [Acetobacteraceae bacterium]|nr:efflux transporter outer membrane subunit [Acetobacteraceae bacterium]